MDSIAVVDDRADQRGTIVKFIVRGLRNLGVEWRVIDTAPLAQLDEYAPWVTENDVRVLVLDEKLTEEIGEVAVDYSGHDVATQLRREIPDLPQVIITAVADSDDLEGAGELDAIVGRDEFISHPNTHIERMVRLGMTFVERHESELAEMTRLSEKLIGQQLTSEESERLHALRSKTSSIASAVGSEGMRQWLDEARQLQLSLEGLLAELKRAQK